MPTTASPACWRRDHLSASGAFGIPAGRSLPLCSPSGYNARTVDAAQLLRGAGKRATPIRREILDALLRLGRPASQPELSKLARLRRLDRVTVYRTLHLLRELGLVHAVQGTDGTWRFCSHDLDGRGCPGNHPHFLCVVCGRMRCLLGQEIPHVEVPRSFEVQGKQLVVYGRCPECGRDA